VSRPSPRTALSRSRSRRLLRTLAVVGALAVAGPALSPLAQADDLHDKKHKVQQGIDQALSSLDDSSKALDTAESNLKAARSQLVDAQTRLAATQGELTAAQALDAQMQAKLAAAEQQLADAQQQVAQGKAAVISQRADIGRLVAGDYQYGDPRLLGLSMVLTAKDPDELASQLGTVDSLMDRESGMYDHLRATEAMLRTQEKKVAEAKQEVEVQRKAAAANLVRRQQLEQQAAANKAEVVALVASRTQAAAAARQVRAHDAQKLKELKKEEARIKKLILARAKQHQGGAFSGDTGGFLLRPVANSYITSPYGWRKHPIYGYWGLHNGDDFHAPCGTPELASADGTVIAEYYSSVWGNRLYLDVGEVNGKAMTLIYNHISSYRARTGQHVSRGEVVSLAGTTGWSTGCHLHFTVMLDGVAVDPTQFF
jgi:murein DD-endopeptidase MepM/ murein hydrolase activator NlpD